jgi:hypothetical protein
MRARHLIATALLSALAACTEDWDYSFGGNSQGGQGGAPAEVACGQTSCNMAEESCCISNDGSTATCEAECSVNQLAIACSEPTHCPGSFCCVAQEGAAFTGTSCQAVCAGNQVEVCPSTANTCSDAAASCTPHPLATGVFYCQTPSPT